MRSDRKMWELIVDLDVESLELTYKNGDYAGYGIPDSHVNFLINAEHKTQRYT